jgi:probable F420-dependent oxidoreductase
MVAHGSEWTGRLRFHPAGRIGLDGPGRPGDAGPVKIGVVFPSVLYREGPDGVARLMRGIEDLGFDELTMFDHVLMGHETETRPAPYYPSTMPILEALMTLAFAASVTDRIGLGTGVLVLPQRQAALVARQVATLDTLSGGRVRLGVGVGWQASEYDALGEDFTNRGRRLDEAVALLRRYWADERIDFDGRHHRAEAMALEPKPPQGAAIPVWIGGAVPQTLERVGRYGDGWMGQFVKDGATARKLMDRIRGHAEAAGRDPDAIGMQLSVSRGWGDDRPGFFTDPVRIRDRVLELRDLGFDWTSIDCVPIFQAGFRTVDAIIEHLAAVRERLGPEL